VSQRPWWTFALTAIAALGLAFATYSSSLVPCSPRNACEVAAWYDQAASWFRPFALRTTLFLSSAIIFVQFLDRAYGRYQYRRDTIGRFLDAVVRSQFNDKGRAHRLTLFKAVGGVRGKLTAVWRLWHMEGKPERHRKWQVIRRLPWRATYLYVYVRASKSHNKRSCTLWRIYESRNGSEGIAGTAWDADAVVTVRDLPTIDLAELAGIETLDGADTPIRVYASSANIDLAHMRAMQRIPRHLMGTIIEDSRGSPFGVLLVDSTDPACPFPQSGPKARQFEREFRTYAQLLSLLVS
jgi:hypothetical protein